MRRVPRWFTGKFFGTFLLVFFGCGSVCVAVTTGAQVLGGLLGGAIYSACLKRGNWEGEYGTPARARAETKGGLAGRALQSCVSS